MHSTKYIQPSFAKSWKFADDCAAPLEVFGTTKAEEETQTFLVGARKEILPQNRRRGGERGGRGSAEKKTQPPAGEKL